MRRSPFVIFFLVFVCILSFLSLVISSSSHQVRGEEGNDPPVETGEMVIEDTTKNFTDVRLRLNGNITIKKNGVLNLENSDILMNSTNISRYSITVLKGGILNMVNSTIARNSSFGFDIEIEGNLSMENCTVSGQNDANGGDDSGMHIRSSNVLINGSSILNWGEISKAVSINNSAPVIRNSVLSGQFFAAFVVNQSHPVFENTTFITSISNGIGLLCNDSSFRVNECNFSSNYFGIDVRTGMEGVITNSVFRNNLVGMIVSDTSGMEPLIQGCLFEENEWSALFLYGNATIENCTFRHNVSPGPINPVAAIYLRESDAHAHFLVSNCTFQENHNALLANDVSLLVSNCSFENNTLYGGTNAILILYPRNSSRIEIRESWFSRNPTSIEVVYAHASASISIQNNTILESTKGIISWNSTLDIRNNDFEDNEVAVEERYRKSSKMVNNTFTDNEARHRHIVRIEVLVQDGYGVILEDALVNIHPTDPSINYTVERETGVSGTIYADIIWEETGDVTVLYQPYTVTASYKGTNGSIQISDSTALHYTVTVPFLRPDLMVSDLKIENRGFSLMGDETRENEPSYIRFTVKNIGEGIANGTVVTVKAGNRIIHTDIISLEPGEEKDFKVKWTPESEGKINISVKVSDPNELNVTENSLYTSLDVGEDQRGYYYLSILLMVLVILLLIWWMVGNIEGAKEDMAEFTHNMKRWLSNLFDTWAKKLRVEDVGQDNLLIPFIPAGDIYSWDGKTAMVGSGKFSLWSIEDENLQRQKKKDIITVQIKIPLPEAEIVEEIPEMETFEWVTSLGRKEIIKVDKRTITKISHPKMFICSLCDRNFVSAEKSPKCPWCAGKAYYLQDM